MASKSATAPRLRSPSAPEAPKEGAFSRLLITPLTFASFIISLFLIDAKNHALRTHSHPAPHSQSATLYGRLKGYAHSICYKPVTISPYAYVRSPDSKEVIGGGGVEGDGETWFWHTTQRKMMKAEVSDAFRLRGGVAVALGICAIGIGLGVVVVGRWLLAVMVDLVTTR